MWFGMTNEDAESSVEEVDSPPASSCRALLPAGVQQTPGMTELGKKKAKHDDRNKDLEHSYLNCPTQETQLGRLRKETAHLLLR